MKDKIKEIRQHLIAIAEEFRNDIGAYSIKIEIEVDCDHENNCDIQINY